MATTGKQKFVLVILLLIVPIGSVLAVRMFQRNFASADGPGGPPAQPQRRGPQGPPGGGFQGGRAALVSVAEVTEETIRAQLSLVGSLKPKEQVQVAPRIAGKIEQVLVNVGDFVEPRQLLAALEGEELDQQVLRSEASLAVAQATLAQRQAELENARADEARSSQLASEGLVSEQERQTAETRGRVVDAQLKLAEAQVRAAQADLAELKIRQQQTQILAPFPGWIGERFVDPGAVVNSNTPIVSVLRLSSLVTEVRVPEQYLGDMREGNRAVVAIDALGGRTFEGRVARISPVLDAATRSGLVQVEIPNRDSQLKAEMSARIQIDTGLARQALVVPREAVIIRGMRSGVHILDEGRARFQQVETGITTDRGVEILEGLSKGMVVVTRGTQGLQDGVTVEVQETRSLSEARS